MTGLPGSGKSALSEELVEKLNALDLKAYVISIDGLRRVATPRPRYSEDEREIVYGALVYTAHTLTLNEVNVIIDATANRRSYRRKARNLIENFVEVYVKCPLKICFERERSRNDLHDAPKGIYDKASRGESRTVPGVGVAYEQPLNPEVTVESDRLSTEKAAEKVLKTLKDKELL